VKRPPIKQKVFEVTTSSGKTTYNVALEFPNILATAMGKVLV
jgi:UDP-N-acetylmuramyl pentapeptide synthase